MEISALSEKIEAYYSDVKGLKSQLAESRNESKAVNKSLQSLNGSIADVRTRLDEQVNEHVTEMNSTKSEISSLKAGIVDFKNEMKPYRTFIEKYADKVKARRTTRAWKKRSSHSTPRPARTPTSWPPMGKLINDQRSELKTMKATVEKHAEDLKLAKEFNKSRDEIVKLKNEVESYASDIKTIKDFIADYKDEMESIRGLIDQFKNDAEHVTPQEAKLIKAGQYLKTQIDQVNNTFSELDERLSAVRKEFINLNNIEYRYRALEDNLNAMERNLENKIEVEMITRVREAENDLVMKVSSVEERVLAQSKESHVTIKELKDMQTATVNILKQTQADVLGSMGNVKSEAVKSVTEAVNEAASNVESMKSPGAGIHHRHGIRGDFHHQESSSPMRWITWKRSVAKSLDRAERDQRPGPGDVEEHQRSRGKLAQEYPGRDPQVGRIGEGATVKDI